MRGCFIDGIVEFKIITHKSIAFLKNTKVKVVNSQIYTWFSCVVAYLVMTCFLGNMIAGIFPMNANAINTTNFPNSEMEEVVDTSDQATLNIVEKIKHRVIKKFGEDFLRQLSKLDLYKICYSESEAFLIEGDAAVDKFLDNLLEKLKKDKKSNEDSQQSDENNKDFLYSELSRELSGLGFSGKPITDFDENTELTFQNDEGLIADFGDPTKWKCSKKLFFGTFGAIVVLILATLVTGSVGGTIWYFSETTYTHFYVKFYCENTLMSGTYITPTPETEGEAWAFLNKNLYKACSKYGYYFSHIESLDPKGL